MSERFSDDLHLVAPEDYVPTAVQDLLAHLHLDAQPKQQQEAGIRDWLKNHPPGRAMTYSLRRKGFGHLIDQRATA